MKGLKSNVLFDILVVGYKKGSLLQQIVALKRAGSCGLSAN